METKRKSAKVAMSLLALAGLGVFSLLALGGSLEPSAPPGSTMKTLDEVEARVPIHAADLPLTITEPKSYYLAEDINFEPNDTNAITIECNDVTIDLAGYSLIGLNSVGSCGININGCSNVEIRNGTIRDFDYPAIVESNSSGSGHRVINIRALSNRYGIILLGYGHLVKDCTAAADSQWGINVGNGSTVTGNRCYDNANWGIGAGNGCTVSGNTVYNNGDSAEDVRGIEGGSGCTVSGNTVYDNGDSATGTIYVISVGNGSTVTDNTVYDNGDSATGDVEGIKVDEGSTITGNSSYNNGTGASGTVYGISAAGYCLVDQNTAYNNGGTNMNTGVGCVLGTNCAP